MHTRCSFSILGLYRKVKGDYTNRQKTRLYINGTWAFLYAGGGTGTARTAGGARHCISRTHAAVNRTPGRQSLRPPGQSTKPPVHPGRSAHHTGGNNPERTAAGSSDPHQRSRRTGLPCQEMVPLASGVGWVMRLFVCCTYPTISERQFNHAVSVRHQFVHTVLLQLQNDAAVLVCFAQPQERLNAVVGGNTDAESTVHDVVTLHQHNLTGGHAASCNQYGRVSVTEQVGNLQVVMVAT